MEIEGRYSVIWGLNWCRPPLFFSGSFWVRSSGLLPPWRPCKHEVYHCVAVGNCIVIPGYELDKIVVEGSASPSIKGGGMGITVKIIGDNLVLSMVQDDLWVLSTSPSS